MIQDTTIITENIFHHLAQTIKRGIIDPLGKVFWKGGERNYFLTGNARLPCVLLTSGVRVLPLPGAAMDTESWFDGSRSNGINCLKAQPAAIPVYFVIS